MTSLLKHTYGCWNGCKGWNNATNAVCTCICHENERLEPQTVPTDEEMAERILDCAAKGPEVGHMEADELLCYALHRLGYHKTVEAWESFGKWYA